MLHFRCDDTPQLSTTGRYTLMLGRENRLVRRNFMGDSSKMDRKETLKDLSILKDIKKGLVAK